MKKTILFSILILILAGCSLIKPLPEDGLYISLSDYKDTVYWREFVIIEISDGVIIDFKWDAVPIKGGQVKSKWKDFEEWDTQTEEFAAYIINTQNIPKSRSLSNLGIFQLIEGMTINATEVINLSSKALKTEPINKSELSDGWYHASENSFTESWLEWADMTVVNGVIISACFNGASQDGGDDKYDRALILKNDFLNDVRLTETFIIQNQSLESLLPLSDDGKSFKIPELKESISKYIELLTLSIDEPAIRRGPFTDGAYSAREKQFNQNTGWASEINFLVAHGSIVSVNINESHVDGIESKKELSENGTLNMVAFGGAKKEWHEQIKLLEEWLIKNQTTSSLSLSEEGTTDDIAGVSIKIDMYIKLTEDAIESGSIEE